MLSMGRIKGKGAGLSAGETPVIGDFRRREKRVTCEAAAQLARTNTNAKEAEA